MPVTCLAIFVISASVLAYEVALMRIFAITHWHHLAYMVISVALLGFGASGTFLSLFQKTFRKHSKPFLLLFCLLFPVSLIICLSLSQKIAFNLFVLIRDWRQFLYLLLYYLVFFIPFFFGATCIGIGFLTLERQIGLLYGANLLGSGLGSLVVVGLLYLLTPQDVVRGIAIASLAAPILVGTVFRGRRTAATVALSVLAAGGIVVFPLNLSISQYKTLSIIRGSVGTRILHTESSPLGRLDVVDSPAIKFDPAPGLSFAFQGEPPPVRGIVIDADAVTVMTDFRGDIENARYLDYTTQALPYHLIKNPRVAILGAGGGSGVLLGLLHNAKSIKAVELDPAIIRLVKEKYKDFCGGIYSLPQVNVVAADGRGFIESSKETFDIIEIALMGSFAASAGGVYALTENYLYTVEAFESYIRHLSGGGILSLTYWVQSPPRDAIKAFATAFDALHRVIGPKKRKDDRLVFIRSWKTATILIKRERFTEDEIRAVREFCESRCFDVVYYPGITREETNRFNVLTDPQRPGFPQPLDYEACMALLFGDAGGLYRDYVFDVTPPTDNRPYFFHFFKWKSLPVLLKIMGRQWAPWGYILLIATLAQAALVSVVLIVIPLFFLKRTGGTPRKTRRLIYFFCLGIAFMFLEMSFMQKFVLFLRHPIYSITVVLFSFLVFSGLGSLFARRLTSRANGRPPRRLLPFVSVVVISFLSMFGLGAIFPLLTSLSTVGRIVASVIILAPLGFFMGMPFPLGLQNVSDSSPALLPWCWGINGCASVIGTVLATTLAISYGFGLVVLIALILYLAAGFVGT